MKFNKLTKQEQKIKIVKDAIKQIKIGLFKPKKGTYIRFPDYFLWDGDNLQELMQRGKKCQVCAKGALFASCVLNVNKVYGRDNFANEEFEKKKLRKWFSAAELDTIECAFEKHVLQDSARVLNTKYECNIDIWDGGITRYDSIGTLSPLAEKAIAFGKRYSKTPDRMLAILRNIARHGSFKP